MYFFYELGILLGEVLYIPKTRVPILFETDLATLYTLFAYLEVRFGFSRTALKLKKRVLTVNGSVGRNGGSWRLGCRNGG